MPGQTTGAGGTGGSPALPSPTPLPLPSGDPVLVGAGDIAVCDGTGDEQTAEIVARTPGHVFTLGDNAYDRGSPDEFRDCFGPSWGRFRDRIAFPVPGNHDHDTRDAAGYREYFGPAAVRDGRLWYSADVGAWHVVVLDSTCDRAEGGCGPDSPQVRWLRGDLAANDAACTVALFHHPRFSSGDHGSSDSVAPFWEVLYEAGVDLVLNGHEHDYQRFAPQDPQGRPDPQGGITQLIAGTGGVNLRAFGDPVPNGVVRSNVANGVIVLTLQQTGWLFRFESVDATFSDQGRGRCH